MSWRRKPGESYRAQQTTIRGPATWPGIVASAGYLFFEQHLDTAQIASRCGITEAVAYNALTAFRQQREKAVTP
jgi:hypothetical protein